MSVPLTSHYKSKRAQFSIDAIHCDATEFQRNHRYYEVLAQSHDKMSLIRYPSTYRGTVFQGSIPDWSVLADAARLNYIPALRVNYRVYGLDSDTAWFVKSLSEEKLAADWTPEEPPKE